ncbi:MAG: hypothetical protein ACQETE_00170 [Bacteroidota bacterium]
MSKLLLMILGIGIFYGSVFAQSNDSAKLDQYYNIKEMCGLDSGDLAIFDHGDKTYPLKSFNPEMQKIGGKVREGNGPGEISGMRKSLTTFSNGDLLLYDAGKRRAFIRDDSLQYIDELRGEILKDDLWDVSLINDSTVFVVSSTAEVFRAYRLNDARIDDSDKLWGVSISEHEELNGLQNVLLLQSLWEENQDGTLYVGFQYSSMLMAVDEQGIQYITTGPEDIGIPYDEAKVEEMKAKNHYEIPIIGEHQKGFRSITVNGDYVYALYQEKELGFMASVYHEMRGNFAIYDYTNMVYRFNRHTGAFIDKFELPVEGKHISSSGNNLYIFNQQDKVARLYRYPIPVSKN